MKWSLTPLVVLVLALQPVAAMQSFDFSEGRWNHADFWEVMSPRWEDHGSWIQRPDHIANLAIGKKDPRGRMHYGPDAYIGLVWTNRVEVPVEFSAAMSFGEHGAPLLVIAPELAEAKDGKKVFREHWEIVLYEKGVNVWHHEFKDGKPSWHLTAYLDAHFVSEKRYTLTVRLTRRHGRTLFTAICDGHEFGYIEPNLPDRFHVGLTGCEGPCRFYDFSVNKDIRNKKR